MTDATCTRCGTTDDTVRERPWHELDVALCARCSTSLTTARVESRTGSTTARVDPRTGLTTAWALLVGGLLLVAAGAATYILTR